MRRFWFARAMRSKHRNNIRRCCNLGMTRFKIVSASLPGGCADKVAVKVKFDDFKEQKKELAPQLAEKSASHLVTRVGNVAALFRPKPVEPQSA